MRKSRKFGVIGNSRKLSVVEVGGAGGGGFPRRGGLWSLADSGQCRRVGSFGDIGNTEIIGASGIGKMIVSRSILYVSSVFAS